MNGFLKKEEKEVKEISTRIKKRDFSGNEGQEIKNSLFTISTSFVTKIGALIFTIIIARLLMPELFGLYSLTLSIIMIFAIFSDMGLGESLIKFVSGELGKNNKSKAKSYALYFLRIKIVLIFLTTFILIILARYFSNNLFKKPLFLGLIAGAFYLFILGISEIVEALLISVNNFKNILWKQTIFQISRIILVPIFVILGLNYSLSNEKNIALIIIGLASACLISVLISYIFARKKFNFLEHKGKKLTKKDKQKTRKFLISMPSIAISGLFFGEIDIILLGYFVLTEFVGYYRAALSLVGGIIGLIAFSSALLPVFSKLNKKQIEKDFTRFFCISILLSIISIILVLIFAPLIIRIIYGEPYLLATNLLRIFSLMILSGPLIALYENFFISQEKPDLIAKILIISTIINITLTFLLITFLLRFGQLQAVYGAIIASIVSNYIILGGLILNKRKLFK